MICEQYAGVDTSDATAAAADIKTGKTAYVNGVKVTGTGELKNYNVIKTVTDWGYIDYTSSNHFLEIIPKYGEEKIYLQIASIPLSINGSTRKFTLDVEGVTAGMASYWATIVLTRDNNQVKVTYPSNGESIFSWVFKSFKVVEM